MEAVQELNPLSAVQSPIIEDFEKLDLVDFLLEHEGVDLVEFAYGDKPYLTACCPLHDERRPSFVVFPNTQRWVCYSCQPEGGDVIDFVKIRYNLSFNEAKKIAAVPVEKDVTFAKLIDKLSTPAKVDKISYAIRANQLFVVLDFEEANLVLYRLDRYLEDSRTFEADLLLKNHGV